MNVKPCFICCWLIHWGHVLSGFCFGVFQWISCVAAWHPWYRISNR